MTAKTGVMMLKIQLFITEINNILKYIKTDFKLFHNIFTVFLITNAAFVSIRHFFQTLKILMVV